MTERERLRQWVQESKSTVFLGGAGVSTASGIPDFRSAHGLYQQKKQGLSYEEMSPTGISSATRRSFTTSSGA